MPAICIAFVAQRYGSEFQGRWSSASGRKGRNRAIKRLRSSTIIRGSLNPSTVLRSLSVHQERLLRWAARWGELDLSRGDGLNVRGIGSRRVDGLLDLGNKAVSGPGVVVRGIDWRRVVGLVDNKAVSCPSIVVS